MAYIGVAKPTVAKFTSEEGGTPKYEKGTRCGKAIKIDIEPQYAEGSLYGDNGVAEYDKEFKSANVTLNTTTLPLEVHEIMFGHTVDKESDIGIKDNAGDEANYIGFGFYVPEKVDGKKKFIAMWMHKVKFAEGSESYQTKGDSIEYQTPSVSGQAVTLEDGSWRERRIFETEKEAQDWVDKQAGIQASEAV